MEHSKKKYLVIYTDPKNEDSVSYSFLDSKEIFLSVVNEIKNDGYELKIAMEINSYNNVPIEAI